MEKRNVLVSVAIMLFGAFMIFGACTPTAAAEKVISIGHIVHLTGAYASGQQGINEGFLDGIELANTHMELPKGIKLKGIWMDGGTDTSKSMTAFKKLVDDGIVVMVGESTAVGVALKKWNIQKKIANVEGGSAVPMFELPSWTFSTAAPYVNEFGAWIDYYLKEVWPKKGVSRAPRFAFLTWDNPFGRMVITDHTKSYLKTKGVELVGEEFIPAVPTDVSAQIMRLKEKGVDFTYGGMYFNAFAVCAKEMEKQGLIDKIDLGTTHAFQPDQYVKETGPLARNTYVTGQFPMFEEWNKVCPKVLEIYKKNKRESLPSTDLYLNGLSKALVACEAVRIALKDIGPDKIGGEAIYNALQKIRNFDVWGTAAPVTFTEKKRYGADSVIMLRLNNEKVNNLGMFPAPNLTGVDWK